MKTILAAADFSTFSWNSIEYAADLANATGSELTLFNAYLIPATFSDIQVLMPTQKELEEYSLIGLRKYQKKIKTRHPKLKVSCVAYPGEVVTEMLAYADGIKPDVIVMGLHGDNFFAEKLIGTNTTAVIKYAKFPVLSVGNKVKFKPIKKSVFACDYQADYSEGTLHHLKRFVKSVASKLHIFNVVEVYEPADYDKEGITDLKFDMLFKGLDISYEQSMATDVIEGVNDFVKENQIDLVIMVPGKHSGMEQLFHTSNTRRMVFHSNVPVLTLPV